MHDDPSSVEGSQSEHEPVDYRTFTQDQREVALDALVSRIGEAHAEALRIVAVADELGDHEVDGALRMADWLAYRYDLSPTTARQWVKAATALAEMPRLAECFREGTVSFEQLVHVLSFAKPSDDASLSVLLPALSHAEAEAMARQRRAVDRGEQRQAQAESHLRFRPDRGGLGKRIAGFLDTELAAFIETCLDDRADAMGPDAETGIWDLVDRRRARALADLCADDLARAASDGSDPEASLVVVHAPLDALTRADNPRRDWDDWHDGDGEPKPVGLDSAGSATIGGAPLADIVLQRLACDTKIEIHVDDENGVTVGIGRASRVPPRWLRRRVTAREHGCCRWPGCARPIRHLHHMTWWTRGGTTDAANLIGLCWHHHHMLHEGGWDATGDADTEIVFTSPHGDRTIRSRAGPIAA